MPTLEYEQSPNFSSRKGRQIKLIVVHWTEGEYLPSIMWLMSKKSKVSSHYIISKEGEILQMVDEKDKAWHAGVSFLEGFGEDLNFITIGIELEGPPSRVGLPGWPEKELESLVWLCKEIKSRYPGIKLTDHHTIAPTRKVDVKKGSGIDTFPWDWLVEETGIEDASTTIK